MLKYCVRVLVFSILAVSTGLALAQKRPAVKTPSRAEDGKVASLEEPDFTRFRVVTDDGILVVFDADEEWDGRDEPFSQLAYWHDYASESLFFFDQLLFDTDDVLQSIATMHRDLPIDPAQLLSEKPELDPLPEITSFGQWRPAVEEDVLAVMSGGQPAAPDEGSISGGLQTHACPDEDCIAMRPPSGPIPGPVRGAQADDLVVQARLVTYCWCWGSGDVQDCAVGSCNSGECRGPGSLTCGGQCNLGPPLSGTPCSADSNPCTQDVCLNGVCTHPPRSGSCASDGNECTEDKCQGGQCTHNPGPLNGRGCTSGGQPPPCTRSVCRDGVCRNETTGCNSDADCPQDNNPCTLSPVCEACGCSYPPKCDDNDPCTTDRCDVETGDCEFVDFSTPLPQDERCETYGCDISLTGLPSTLLVNDDDDNGNGVADYQEIGAIAGENDVVCTSFTESGCPLTSGPACYGHCDYDHWHPLASSTAIGLFGSVDRDPLSWDPDCYTWPPPNDWCVEGRRSDFGACPQGWDIQVVGWDSEPGYCCRWRSDPVKVVQISSLTWEKANLNNADLGACPNNGGQKIFPDKLNPNDGSASVRQQVMLVATITPPVAGVQVRFRIFDVDDPFDQLHGTNTGLPDPDPTKQGNQEIIADVNLIDTDRAGPDNRPFGTPDPAFGGGNTFTEPTVLEVDTQGVTRAVAKKLITVSMQPGNNYRAAATLLPSVLGGAQPQITQTTADNLSVATDANGKFVRAPDVPGYKCPVTWSPMLTVWRQLTLEVDSMSRESESYVERYQESLEQDRCVVASIAANSPDPGLTTISCGPDPNPNRAGYAGTNYFEGGAFWCTDGGQQWLIARSSLGTDSYQLIVSGTPGMSIVGQECKLRDDDPYFGSGAGQLPRLSILDANIRAAFRDAYIEIIEANSGLNPRAIVPWNSHLSETGLAVDYNLGSGIGANTDLSSQPSFWVRRLVACYQGGVDEDFEADQYENGSISHNVEIPGLAPYPAQHLSSLQATVDPATKSGLTIRGPALFPGTGLTTVYLETIRDKDIRNDTGKLWQYIAHEVGHMTLDQNGHYLSEEVEHAELGLMTEGNDLQNLPGMQQFSSPTIVRFRSAGRW